MEGINHSCRERPSWSDGGVGNGIKTLYLPCGSQGTLLLADQHILQHASPASPLLSLPSASLALLSRALLRRSLCLSAVLHYSTTSITASAPNDWRIRCTGEPLRSRAGGQRVRRLNEKESPGIDRREGRTPSRSPARRNDPARSSFVAFPSERPAASVNLFPGYLLFGFAGLSRPRARANICPSQSPGIIWDKHSRCVINPAVRFPLRILQRRTRGFHDDTDSRRCASASCPVTGPILHAGLTATKLSRRRR